jgi:predicted Zn-dependent protease
LGLTLLALACAWLPAPPPAHANVLDGLEDGVGRALAREVEVEEGIWRGPSTNALLASIAADLFTLRSRDFRYEVRLLDDLQINAYSLPGGHIYMLRGLLAHAANIDEVAGVLAHEMGHQEDADFRRFATREILWLSLAGLVRHERGSGAADLTNALGVLNMLRHSRRQEAEADTRAVAFCLQTGYDPDGIASFLARIKQKHTGYLETVLATHPDADRRLTLVAERTTAALADHPAEAWHVCRSLAARGRPVTAYRLAHKLAAQPAHRWWAEAEAASLKPAFDSARGVAVVVPQPSSADKALRAPLDAIRTDSRIRWALELAQVAAPEPTDVSYLSTLALALAAIGRLNRALQSGYEAAYRVACAPEAVHPEDRDRFLASVGRLRRGGIMIAAVLGELTGLGPDRPLGSLDGARTGLLWAQAEFAFKDISAGQSGVDALLALVTLDLARRNVAQLTTLSTTWPDPTASTLRAVGGRGVPDILSSWRARMEEAAAPAENMSSGKVVGHAADVEDVYLVSRLALNQLAGETRAANAVADATDR